MVLRQPLFQQNDTTDQSADIFRLFIRDFTLGRQGLLGEDSLKVAQRGAGANNSVDIASGSIIIPGTENAAQGYYYVVNDATVNLVMSTAAHGSLPRIDTVAVRVRDSFYSTGSNDAEFVYVAGTAAASPVAPDLDALGYENHARLANISVPANDNTIVTGDITDIRVQFSGRASAVGGAQVTSNAPLTPRNGQLWFDTSNQSLKVNVGSSASPTWATVGVTATWTTFTPTWGSVVLGTGATNYGRYMKIGRLAIAIAGFVLGTSGNVTSRIFWTPPSAIALATYTHNSTVAVGWGGGNIRYGSVAIHAPAESDISRFAGHATNIGWDDTQPIDWVSGSQFNMLAIYETSAV